MNELSINGVTIEKCGNRWHAFADGVCGAGKTPMMAYIEREKVQLDQYLDDKSEQLNGLYFDYLRMEAKQ